MAKVVLNDVQSLANTTSAKQLLNNNFDAIEEAIENTLSRDGSTPNQMEADIDMNSNDLLNVGVVDAGEYRLNGVPIEQAVTYANKQYDLFSGTGSETEFLMNKNPGSLGNLEVSIEGVMQRPGLDFYFDGNTLVFVVPPPEGEDNILARYDEALPANVADAAAILYTPPSTLVPGSIRSFLDSLWSASTSAGAALIRFIQRGVGAIARTVLAKLQERLTLADFGAVGDGVTNDTAAVKAAIAEAIASDRTLYLGAGNFLVDEELVYILANGQHLSIEGEGSTRTELICNTTTGTLFDVTSTTGNWWVDANPQNKVSFRKFTVSTLKTNLGTAFKLSLGSLEGRPGPQHIIEEIEVRAHSGFSQYFAIGFDLLDCAGMLCDGVNVIQGGPGNLNGTGFLIRSTDATTDPSPLYFTRCNVVYGDVAWVIQDHVEGVYLTNSNGINNNQGVVWIVAAESGIHFTGCHFNNYVRNLNLGGVFDGVIEGCLLYQNGADPTFRNITMDNCGSISVTGNQLRGANVATCVGIAVSNVVFSGDHGIVIGGNHITLTGTGIELAASSTRVVVGDNQYLAVTTRVSNLNATNFVRRREVVASQVVNLTGGAATELVDVPLPANMFIIKPTTAFISGETQDLDGAYQFESASTTASNARFKVWTRDGTNISAGATRVNLLIKE